MGAVDILAALADIGATVEAAGDKLRVHGAERLTDDLRAAIRANKAELLDELRAHSGGDAELLRVEAKAQARAMLAAPART